MRIYIGSAYTAATPEEVHMNVCRSLDAATQLLLAGHIPFAPLTSHFWHLHNLSHGVDVPYDRWLTWAMTWVLQNEAYLHLTPSPGANKELALAEEHGLIIFRTLPEALAWREPTAAERVTQAIELVDRWAQQDEWTDSDACAGRHMRRYVSEPE